VQPADSHVHVQVIKPSVTHHVKLGQVRGWLELGPTNGSEEAKKNRW